MKNNVIALSIFCLAVCFVIGSWLIANGLKNEGKISTNQQTQHQLLTQAEVADYFGLSVEEVQKLSPAYAGVTTSVIPYIKIGNKFYYSKSAIDKWLQSQGSISVQ